MSLRAWLKRPYPLIESIRYKLILILAFGIFVSFFLLIYKPFGADRFTGDRLFFLFGFGASVSTSLTFMYLILPSLFPGIFKAEKWNIEKEILFLIMTFVVVSILNYVYNATIVSSFAQQRTWLEFLGITVAVGIFPTIILIFLVELFLNNKNTSKARELNALMEKQAVDPSEQMLEIIPETTRSDKFVVPISDFLFAKSDNNYTTIFYETQQGIDKELLRLSLKKVEEQLSSYESIVRCHKTYIVNRVKIKALIGNARSLNIQIENCEENIPVSRGFPKEKLIPKR